MQRSLLAFDMGVKLIRGKVTAAAGEEREVQDSAILHPGGRQKEGGGINTHTCMEGQA